MSQYHTQASPTFCSAPTERKGRQGFSLIELVITITIVSAISVMAMGFLYYPVQSYSDIARRAQLVYTAEQALRRMERDIRNSIPNSLRVKSVGGIQAIEMINVVEGFRYRRRSPGGNAAVISFNQADVSFNIFNTFPAAMLGNNGYRAIVYNIGAEGAGSDAPISGANVYASGLSAGPFPPVNTHVISPAATTMTLSNVGNEGQVVFAPGFQFGMESPQQRIFFTDTPISYVCNSSTGSIIRYQDYTIQQTQPYDSTVAPLNTTSSALLANQVSACNFTYQPGTSRRSGTIGIQLTMMGGNEQIRLMQQIAVSNAP